jgi:hypothetical protein
MTTTGSTTRRAPAATAAGILTLALGFGLTGATGVPSTAAAASGGVSCEINVSPRAGGVALQGMVRADHAVAGSYELIVTQSGGGGGSDIQQAGEFSAGAGRSAALGTVVLGGAGGNFKARLKLTWDGSTTQCRESGPL